MKPLIILLASFAIAITIVRLITGSYDFPLAARIGIAVMLAFTAIGHFVFTKGMTMMMPAFIPFRPALIYITGIMEVALGAGLLIPSATRTCGWLIIAFFIVLLPANVYAATQKIDYQKGTAGGPGLPYLWFRVPLQLLFIAWVYLSAIGL